MCAIDEYGDEDTRAAVEQLMTASTPIGGMDQSRVLEAVNALDPARCRSIILGGGLDGAGVLVDALVAERPHIGNSVAIRKKVKDPKFMFSLLDDLGIPYPGISWDIPDDQTDWLHKSGCSEGGRGVRFLSGDQVDPGDYFQRRLKGCAYSALFLANGENARMVGFNTLHNVMLGQLPFMFVGAANFTDLAPAVVNRVAGYTLDLVRELGLLGLNSIDFMLDQKMDPRLLEINARPSATMSLYDEDVDGGLLNAHIQAVKGHLPAAPRTGVYRIFNMIEAPRTLVIPEGLRWPSWCKDRPCANTVIPKTFPVCSVEAEATTPRLALRLLLQRMTTIEDLLGGRKQSSSIPYLV